MNRKFSPVYFFRDTLYYSVILNYYVFLNEIIYIKIQIIAGIDNWISKSDLGHFLDHTFFLLTEYVNFTWTCWFLVKNLANLDTTKKKFHNQTYADT